MFREVVECPAEGVDDDHEPAFLENRHLSVSFCFEILESLAVLAKARVLR